MNWFDEGVLAAQACDLDNDKMIPDCPWPIYAPEGAKWFRGWNSVSVLVAKGREERIRLRPSEGRYRLKVGHLFSPSDADLDRADGLMRKKEIPKIV
jgi:hypothetical protein